MRDLKIYLVKGVFLVSVFGTLLHFAYAASDENAIVGLFTPKNESTWEHMKLLFFPMLLFSLSTPKALRAAYPCLDTAMARGMLLGTLSIAAFFYTYTGIIGFSVMMVDILLFYISVLLAFFIAYKGTLSKKCEPCARLWKLLVLATTLAFIFFSLFPPALPLFQSPV